MQSLFALIADTKNAQEGITKIMKALKVDEKKASVMMDKLIAYALKKEELENEGFASDAQRRAAFASGYKAKGKDKKKDEQIQEDGHTDVSSAIRQCKTMVEDATQIMSKLQTMNPEESLPSWWTNKLAVSSNSMNKLRDYFLVPTTEELEEHHEKDENGNVIEHCLDCDCNPCTCQKEEQMDEAIKYTYVAVDDKGKIIGFSGGSKATADAKDMARRNNGVVHKLKKPMSQKVGDMEINRPFNPVLKAEVEEVEESAMLNLATVKFQAKKEKLGKIRHKVTQKGKKYIISVDSNDEEDAQKAMKDHPLYAAGKLRVMPESFYKKITGVDSLRENRANRDAMRNPMQSKKRKRPSDVDTDATDDDVCYLRQRTL